MILELCGMAFWLFLAGTIISKTPYSFFFMGWDVIFQPSIPIGVNCIAETARIL